MKVRSSRERVVKVVKETVRRSSSHASREQLKLLSPRRIEAALKSLLRLAQDGLYAARRELPEQAGRGGQTERGDKRRGARERGPETRGACANRDGTVVIHRAASMYGKSKSSSTCSVNCSTERDLEGC